MSEYKSNAEFAAATLRKMGLESEHLVSVPAPKTAKDRTYASAVAVKDWLTASDSGVHAVNVFSVGPHAQRTRLLFQKAFGDEVAVGVISGPDEEYDQRQWWASSAGVRTVLSEIIAYLYASFFSDLPMTPQARAVILKPELNWSYGRSYPSNMNQSETSHNLNQIAAFSPGDQVALAALTLPMWQQHINRQGGLIP